MPRRSIRSDQCGGKGVLLFVGATRAFARLTQLPATRPPQLAPPIGLSAEQIHHTSCRGLYDSATNGRPSPTRRNTDRLVCRLNRRNIHNILETNVICYSTPMSADLRMSAHDGGAGKGEEIFRFLLDEITPAVLIVQGVGSVKQVSNILNVPLPKVPKSADEISEVQTERHLVILIPSLAPPEFKRWSSWSGGYLENVADRVRDKLAG